MGNRGMGRVLIGSGSASIGGADISLPASLVTDEGQTALRVEEQIIGLFDTFRIPIYRYLVCTHVSPEDADEIIQETFLRLYVQVHGGNRIENLKGWMFRVAHNLGVNGIKSRKHVTPKTSEEWLELVESRSDPSPGPEEVLIFKEKMTRLYSTIFAVRPD